MSKSKMANIQGAEKKLRQAEFFMRHLGHLSRQPDYQGRRDPEHLEFFFSASLTAAQSVYSVLCHSGGATFQNVRREWLKTLTDGQQSFFNTMRDLRDDDVHRASTSAESLPTYVEADLGRHESPYYQSAVYNAALFGPRPIIEQENPDGKKVSGHALLGTTGLYIKQGGQYVEATTACRQFIEQLRSFLDAMKAALKMP